MLKSYVMLTSDCALLYRRYWISLDHVLKRLK